MCLCKSPFWLNALPQCWHLYGLSPVWVRMWFCKLPLWLNPLPQCWHLYGLSPVWVRMCFCKSPLWLNPLPQCWHLNGLSPVWVRMWVFNSPLDLNRLPQCWHSNGFWSRTCEWIAIEIQSFVTEHLLTFWLSSWLELSLSLGSNLFSCCISWVVIVSCRLMWSCSW